MKHTKNTGVQGIKLTGKVLLDESRRPTNGSHVARTVASRGMAVELVLGTAHAMRATVNRRGTGAGRPKERKEEKTFPQ
jgi:hypothetical protein